MTDAVSTPIRPDPTRSLNVQRLIERLMLLHTSHVQGATGSELGRLANNPQSPLVVYAHRKEGWLISVPEQTDLAGDTQFHVLPEELVGVLQFARQHGCDWLLLDVDGETYSMLPTWD